MVALGRSCTPSPGGTGGTCGHGAWGRGPVLGWAVPGGRWDMVPCEVSSNPHDLTVLWAVGGVPVHGRGWDCMVCRVLCTSNLCGTGGPFHPKQFWDWRSLPPQTIVGLKVPSTPNNSGMEGLFPSSCVGIPNGLWCFSLRWDLQRVWDLPAALTYLMASDASHCIGVPDAFGSILLCRNSLKKGAAMGLVQRELYGKSVWLKRQNSVFPLM